MTEQAAASEADKIKAQTWFQLLTRKDLLHFFVICDNSHLEAARHNLQASSEDFILTGLYTTPNHGLLFFSLILYLALKYSQWTELSWFGLSSCL